MQCDRRSLRRRWGGFLYSKCQPNYITKRKYWFHGLNRFLKCITKILYIKNSWKLQALFQAMDLNNLIPSAHPTSQHLVYGCHVMQLLNEAKNHFLKFPTIFRIEESCGVVEITFPTIAQNISLLLCPTIRFHCPLLC